MVNKLKPYQDFCPNPQNNIKCYGVKVKVSSLCQSCNVLMFHKGKTFNERYGVELATKMKNANSEKRKEYIKNNPEKHAEHSRFFDQWVKKYGKREANRRLKLHTAKTPRFKRGKENVNYLPHVQQIHAEVRMAMWSDPAYRKQMSDRMLGNQFSKGGKAILNDTKETTIICN